MESRQFTDQDGTVYVVSWHRLNPPSPTEPGPGEPEYNVWVTKDGEEIEMESSVYWDDVKTTVRQYRRRALGRGRRI